MNKRNSGKNMKKRNISRIIIGALLISTLLVTNSTAVQAKSSYVNIPQSYTITSATTTAQVLDSSWGLGENQTESISNNRSYDWYIDQGNTGSASNNNCGPSCAVMTMKWLSSNFAGTVEDARNIYPENGGWWKTNNISNFFDLNGVNNYSINQTVNETQLKKQIKQGNIAILCINTTYLPYNKNSEERVGRFYTYEGGHFIIVKGYRVVDGKTYFEVYDSNNFNKVYQNGQQKGKDRYYLSSDLINAASNWWNYSIIIQPGYYY